MNFSERTSAIALLVKNEGVKKVADVGCDHGLTSYMLLKSEAIDYVHLIDISEKNLNKAKKLLKSDYEAKISFSVCDGLKAVKENEIELAIITGMGANEIKSILNGTNLDIKFVLQPMKNLYELRTFLSSNGFVLEKDFVRYLDNRFYDFLVCKRGNETLSQDELIFGKTNLKERSYDFIMQLKHNILVASDILRDAPEEKHKKLVNYILKAKEIIDASEVTEIAKKIEQIVPKSLSDEYVKKFDAFDNHGLIVGDGSLRVNKIMLCLDVTNEIIDECIKKKVNLIISHHPLVFYPINNISTEFSLSNKVVRLIKNNIALISLHLSLDIVEGGVNTAIGEKFLGKKQENIEKLNEEQGLGEIKELAQETSFLELVKYAKKEFPYEAVRWYGKDKKVKKIAYIGGAGSLSESEIKLLIEKQVDAYITGEMKHHEILSCLDNGLNLILLGHFNSEVVVLDNLKSMLSNIIDKDIEIMISKKLALN